jgi:LmbE family N-acetylglucosaminyl deacetylase
MEKKILIIAAHPDDETLGCGGTIARHTAQGDFVSVLILADGVTARSTIYNPELEAEKIKTRENDARKAMNVLGVQEINFLRLPDNRMDSLPLLEITKKIETHIDRLKPKIIYTHHANDLNIDHRITHHATLTACRPKPGHCVCAIYAFEVLSSTEWEPTGLGSTFNPMRFVDISSFLEAKKIAMAAYSEEIAPFPNPRSLQAITAQSNLRGAQAGLLAAESFMVIREII